MASAQEWPWFFEQERREQMYHEMSREWNMARDRDMEQRRRDMIPLVDVPSFMAHIQERGTPGARRSWMELERQLRDDSDSDEGADTQKVDWPRRQLRTDIVYDQVECYPGYNLRCVKWGPKGGTWEHHWTPMVAQGPPNENLRYGQRRCWLCDAGLVEHKRTWTRPSWNRQVGWTRFSRPYERLKNKDDVVAVEYSKDNVVTKYTRHKEKPPSQLRMTIYCCPNGCDADDALQALLDKTDHTGPATRPPHAAPWPIFMGSATWPLTQYLPRRAG